MIRALWLAIAVVVVLHVWMTLDCYRHPQATCALPAPPPD